MRDQVCLAWKRESLPRFFYFLQLSDLRIQKRGSWALLGSAQCREKRQWTQVGTWEILIRYQENKFTLKLVKQQKMLPRKVVESLSLERFKTHMDTDCSNVI